MLLSCHSAYCSAAWIGEDVRLAQGTDWRYPTSPEDRIMKNTGTICVRVYVFLLVILKGIFSKEVNDKYVTFLDKVTAWTGSCVVLPCTYTKTDRETIHNFTWYHDAVYNETIKDFVGTVVYNNKDDKAVGSPFANLVQHIGKKDGDCTIMITDLQMEHKGSYQLRLRGESKELQFRETGFKWMSRASLAITVFNANSSIKISSPKEIKELTPVMLTCSVDYYCPLNNISLSWTGNVSGTTTTSSTHGTTGISTTATFSFVPTWQDDKKNLTCTLSRGDEQEETETIQLDVKHKPKNVQLLPSNSTITIYKGEKVTLTCEVGSSNPPVHATHWYKDREKIDLNQKLNKIEATTQGQYYCSAVNSQGKDKSNSVQVSVLYAPIKPQIKKLGNITEGSTLSLTCSTQANPAVTEYIWYKDNKICHSCKTYQYEIIGLKIQDSGGYKCSARNIVDLTVSDTFNVDVMYPPKKVAVFLTPDGTTFIEGTKVTFHCDVNRSNPEVQRFVWYKDGKIQQTFSKTYSKSIQAEDAGSYYCQAENRIGASKSPVVQINVLYRPKSAVLQVLRTEIKDGDDVCLECKPGARNPEITSYQWYKDGILQSTTESAHRLLKATLTDSGAYTCKAFNEIGGTESSPVTIDVQYAPRNVTASIFPDRHVSEHTQVKMTCTAKANPTEHTITWYRNNEPHLSSKYLSLLDVQLEDEGEYYCVVYNKVGDKRSNTIQLQVSYSNERIIKIVAIAVSVFIILIFLIFLIVRYRARIRKAFSRKEPDDMADSSFFVLKKKSHNDPIDNAGRQTPSASGSTDQLNCSSRIVSSSIRVPTIIPRSGTNNETNNDEITTIYSVVKKPGNVPEYENIKSSGETLDESQDDIQYSEIAHLSKEGTRRERCPEVEYAMLKQS